MMLNGCFPWLNDGSWWLIDGQSCGETHGTPRMVIAARLWDFRHRSHAGEAV